MTARAFTRGITPLIVIAGVLALVVFPYLNNRVVPYAPDEVSSDTLDLNLPHRLLLWEGIRNHELPIWRADISTGFPLLAEAQTGIFDPFQYLLFRSLPFVLANNLRMLIALLIAAVGAYYYGKRVGLGQFSSTVVGIAVALSGYTLGNLKHVQIFDAVAYFPWMLLAVEHLVSRKSPGAGIILGAAVGLSLLAGHPPTTAFMVFGCTAYLLFRLASDPTSRRESPGTYGTFVGGMALGAAIAAVQILPSFEVIRESTRQFGTALGNYTTFHPKFLLTAVWIWILGDPSRGTFDIYQGLNWWENMFTIGALGTVLAVLGIRRRTAPAIGPTVGLGLLGILMAIGPISWLPRLLWFGFPGLTLTRIPSRFLFLLSWALAVLAGFGTERLVRWLRPRVAPTIRRISVAVLLAGVTLPLALALRSFYRPVEWSWITRRPPTVDWLREHLQPYDRIFSVDFTTAGHDAMLQAHGWRGDLEPFASTTALLRPDLTLYHGLINVGFPNEFNGAFSIARRVLLGLATDGNAIEQPYAAKLLGLEGVRYLLAANPLNERAAKQFRPPTEVPIPGPGPVTKVRIYENPNVLPRAYLVGSLLPYDASRGALFQLTEPDFDPSRTALVESVPPGWTDHVLGTASVAKVEEGNRRATVRYRSETPAFLVLGDSYSAGWTANVDRSPTPIHITNIAFRGVAVPAGEHTVTFTYAPRSLSIGYLVSALGIAVALGLGIASATGAVRARRRSPLRTPQAPR